MDTIRPVKRLDSVGSLRASAEFVGSDRQRAGSSGSHRSRGSGSSELSDDRAISTAETSPDLSHPSNGTSNDVSLGHALVDEIVVPVLDRLSLEPSRQDGTGSSQALGARSIEALSMIRKGFEDLADNNPALAWHAMAEILSGINECVLFLPLRVSEEELTPLGFAGTLGSGIRFRRRCRLFSRRRRAASVASFARARS